MRAFAAVSLLAGAALVAGCAVNAESTASVALPAGYSPMLSLAPLVETVEPAVVNVYVSARKKTGVPPQMQYFLGLPSEQTVQGQGSGFLITSDGYIVTNNHVAEDADSIKVKFQNDEEYSAKVVGTDPSSDIALLKIEAKKPLPYLKFGDSEALRVGDWVVAVGNPLGLGHTVTAGIVSGKGRFIPDLPLDEFIQTDASINPGNSGGPLISTNGLVVGMNTAIVQGANTVGFAIPSDHLAGVVEQLKSKGKVDHGYMGVMMAQLDEAGRRQLGVDGGVLVQSVVGDGPAEKAGLKPGDIILKVGTKVVNSNTEVTRAVSSQTPGEKVAITVRRGDKEQVLTVTLAPRPTPSVN